MVTYYKLLKKTCSKLVEYFNEITNPTWMKYVICDNNGNIAIWLYQNQNTTYTFQIKTKSTKNDHVNMYELYI
jgi:hypothetical protein